MEFTLLWAALTAAALGWAGLRIWTDHLPEDAWDKMLAAAVAGLVVGRLVAMVSQGVNPVTNPGDILIIRGGVATPAATVTFIGVLGWATRTHPRALDAIAPSALLGLAGWHLGCLWRGACLGTASDLPWAWALEGSSVTRHPVELYAAIGLAAAAYLVSRLGWSRWLRAGSGLALAGLIRLVTEPMRPSLAGGPVWWYATAIATGAALATAGWLLSEEKPSAAPT